MNLFPLTRRRLFFLIAFVVLCLTLFVLGSISPPPTVSSTSPLTNQVNVLLDSPISLHFTSPISPRLRRQLTISSLPPIFDTPRWNKDGTAILLNPSSPLTKNTSYLISLSYQNKPLYSFGFTTNPYDTQDLRDQSAKQAADDQLYGQKATELINQYPWYPNLPIITPQYYIFYSFADAKFKIHLTQPSPTITEQQEQEAAALSSLRQIGVTPQELKYVIVIDSP